MVEPDNPRLSIVHQCEPASISRSSIVLPRWRTRRDGLIDEQFLETPRFASDGPTSAAQRLVHWPSSGPAAEDQDGFGSDLSASEGQSAASAA